MKPKTSFFKNVSGDRHEEVCSAEFTLVPTRDGSLSVPDPKFCETCGFGSVHSTSNANRCVVIETHPTPKNGVSNFHLF